MQTPPDSGYVRKASPIIVLFVDGDGDTRRAHAAGARAAGFGVELARDGEEALAKVLLGLPHVVVTEARIAGVDGFELARWTTTTSRTRVIPVIMLTGLIHPDLTQKARASGCAALLRKPCTFEALERTIRRTLREIPGDGALTA